MARETVSRTDDGNEIPPDSRTLPIFRCVWPAHSKNHVKLYETEIIIRKWVCFSKALPGPWVRIFLHNRAQEPRKNSGRTSAHRPEPGRPGIADTFYQTHLRNRPAPASAPEKRIQDAVSAKIGRKLLKTNELSKIGFVFLKSFTRSPMHKSCTTAHTTPNAGPASTHLRQNRESQA
jgi:hypothetical protein